MHHVESEIDRNQMSMIALEQMVAEDSYARLVDVFVDSLPLRKLGFKHIDHEQSGRPPYHPAVLLKLYMYGYRHGLRSSNKLHQACLVNVELWWLLKGLKPSARTICYFRKNNAPAFKAAFRHFVLLLKEWKLIEGETIAIDSFKIRAQNSLKQNYNQAKIDRHIDYIDDKIRLYQQELDTADGTLQKAEIQEKIQYQKDKKGAYKAIEKELHESGEKQLSKTDKDARAVVLHRNIVNVGYNVQAGSDAKHKLFVNAQTGKVNDTHALADMAIEAKELLGVKRMNTLTDKGYTTGFEIARCADHNITTYSAPKAHPAQKNGLFNMAIFSYSDKHDNYTCPAGEELKTNGSIYNKGRHKVKHYKTKACKHCSISDRCTTNKAGRIIERTIYQEFVEQNQKRVEDNPQYYRLRQQITEHPFGTIKRQWGFTHTLMRGRENVMAEVFLNFQIYNLIRTAKILGCKELMVKIKSLFALINPVYNSLVSFLRLWNQYSFRKPFSPNVKNNPLKFVYQYPLS